ncbi:unnamed protein product, partial [Cladocopium goreaui]
GSLYDVLGVDKNASEQEIKKAYKRAAVKFHPDKAPESERPQYEERFKRISRAYEILSDPEKRRAYDLRGESAFDGAGGGAQGGFGPGVDPFDMFRSMFGQNFGFGVARTPDVGYEVEVTMEEMYKGFNKSVRYDRDAVCRTCQGMGATQIETCVFCNGRGVIVEDRQVGPGYFQRVQRHCQRCGGQGAQARNRCSKCRGKGFVKEQVDLNVSAPPGCPDRKRFMFQGKADEALLGVLLLLAPPQLAALGAAARVWRQALRNPELWRQQFLRRGGEDRQSSTRLSWRLQLAALIRKELEQERSRLLREQGRLHQLRQLQRERDLVAIPGIQMKSLGPYDSGLENSQLCWATGCHKGKKRQQELRLLP